MAGKRDKVISVEGSGSEETADQEEIGQKDNGSANKAVEESEEERSDARQPVEDNETIEEQKTTVAIEGSSKNDDKDENIENDD